jgi:two-component system OmpR family sensor kinase
VTARAALPLVARVTRRLVAIAAAVLLVSVSGFGLYYSRDPGYLRDSAVTSQMARLEAALLPAPDGRLVLAPEMRRLFDRHPEAYGFALVDGQGTVLDGANRALLPAEALETGMFATDWIARPDGAAGLIVASHRVGGPERYLRLVFVAVTDPAGLVRGALLREIVGHGLLPLAPAALILLAANAWMIRRSLAPLGRAARWAREVRPGAAVPPCPDGEASPEIRDLTSAARTALDRLAEALEGERRRAAEAAHALRTPVAVLTARLDALPEGEVADHLRADVAALARTVRQVLDSTAAEMVRIEEGESVDLVLLAEDSVAALAPFGFERGVALELVVDSAARPALGNARAIALALDNLIENAILHGRGSARVQVGPGATLSVEDGGPGLPEQDRDALFEPFRRGPGARPGGAGLGLAIVARIQRAHGGTVEAGDAPGGGALLRLAYRPAPEGAARSRQAAVRQTP